MATEASVWQQTGNLKGPKGDAGPTGKSMRAASVDVGSNTDVSASVISPNTDIQPGDVIVDAKGEGYTVTSVNGDTVHVSNVLDGFNLRGPKGDPGEGADVPIASATVAGKVKVGDGLQITEDGTVSLYKAIALAYLQGGGSYEVGSTVDDVTLSWDWNKVPASLTLDGEEVAKVDGAYPKQLKLTGLGLKANKTWTLVATDEKGAKSTKTATVAFKPKRYWGAAALPGAGIDSAFVLALAGSELADDYVKTFSASAGDGQYVFYAIPTSFGGPRFFVGGFEGGFNKAATIDLTNASGSTQQYDVWQSTNAALGDVTVDVKK